MKDKTKTIAEKIKESYDPDRLDKLPKDVQDKRKKALQELTRLSEEANGGYE